MLTIMHTGEPSTCATDSVANYLVVKPGIEEIDSLLDDLYPVSAI